MWRKIIQRSQRVTVTSVKPKVVTELKVAQVGGGAKEYIKTNE
jgi:hypothetical protein